MPLPVTRLVCRRSSAAALEERFRIHRRQRVQTEAPTTIAGIRVDADIALTQLCAELSENERAHRAATAESYVHAFRFLLAYARQERDRFTPDELTVPFLKHVDKGKLMRKAAPAFAQLKRTTDRKAENFLLAAVNLMQHGPQLIERLWAGHIPAEHVRVAAEKLGSLTPPKPTATDSARSGTGEDLAAIGQRHDDAKNALGRQLEQLADPDVPERDFAAAARKLRDELHPDPAPERHEAALRRRCVRIAAAPDGMAKLFAHISADAAATISQLLRQGATGTEETAAQHTRSQREADLFVELLTRDYAGAPTADLPVAGVPVPTGAYTPALPGLAPATPPPECACGRPKQKTTRRFFAYLLIPFNDWMRIGGRIASGTLDSLRETYPEHGAKAGTPPPHPATRGRVQRPSSGSDEHPDLVRSRPSLIGSPHQLSDHAVGALMPHIGMLQAVLTHPATGYPVGLGVRTRRPSPRIRDLLLLRDQRCRFPGCDVPGTECEVDHVTDFALGGTSDLHGLALLCKKHHGGKSAGWWQVRLRPELGDGVLQFHFPQTGRTELTSPALPLDPHAWQEIRGRLEEPPF